MPHSESLCQSLSQITHIRRASKSHSVYCEVRRCFLTSHSSSEETRPVSPFDLGKLCGALQTRWTAYSDRTTCP